MVINYALEVEDINTILEGLMELPAKRSLKIIQKLEQEAKEQIEKQIPKQEGKSMNLK